MTDETKCPVPNCHGGMLRSANGRDSVSCPVCDGVVTSKEFASPASAGFGGVDAGDREPRTPARNREGQPDPHSDAMTADTTHAPCVCGHGYDDHERTPEDPMCVPCEKCGCEDYSDAGKAEAADLAVLRAMANAEPVEGRDYQLTEGKGRLQEEVPPASTNDAAGLGSHGTGNRAPLALIVQGRESAEIVAWACGRCGTVHQHEANARGCIYCSCGRCGQPRTKDQHGSMCPTCHTKMFAEADEREAAKERARHEAAVKVPFAQYEGDCFYSPEADGGGGGEGFFFDLGEFFDHFDDDGKDAPSYVWACAPTKLTLDAENILSNALENGDFHEEAGEDIPRGAEKRLQRFLDAWAKKYSPTSYFPDYRTAIDLTAEIAERKTDHAE